MTRIAIPWGRVAARFGLGFVLAAPAMVTVWLLERVPESAYDALALVPSSPISYLLPAAITAVAALALGGPGLAGAVVGMLVGFLAAARLVAPTYQPHPWDELDGVWHAWFWIAGFRTVVVAATAGLVVWAIAGVARWLGARAGRSGSGAFSGRSS